MPRRIKNNKNFRKRFIGDNEFGSISEDVFRRDFTINALYFDIDQKVVIDYVGGFYDLTDRKISCIGNPFERFEEDPHANSQGNQICNDSKTQYEKYELNRI